MLCAALTLWGVFLGTSSRAEERNAAEEAQRWALVSDAVFHGRAMQEAGDAMEVIVPDKALDAALVPVTVKLDSPKRIAALTLFVDNNPAPLVGTFHFGPAMSPSQIKMRVRVNVFTPVHAVAETEDGTLLIASRFVKAAGGCSAPSAGQSADIAAKIGQMQLRRTRGLEGTSIPSQLLISHPNYNGMQMNPGAADFIPARYLETVSVKSGGVKVFDLTSDISLSEDPVINFAYTPAGDGGVDVEAHDSTGAIFTRHFDPMAN
jgi:sulfur-oxidizing protein SoxY